MVDKKENDILETASLEDIFEAMAKRYGKENALFKIRATDVDTDEGKGTIHTVYMKTNVGGVEKISDIFDVQLLKPNFFDVDDLDIAINLLNGFYAELGIWSAKLFTSALNNILSDLKAETKSKEDKNEQKLPETEEEFETEWNDFVSKLDEVLKEKKK